MQFNLIKSNIFKFDTTKQVFIYRKQTKIIKMCLLYYYIHNNKCVIHKSS